MAPLRGGNSRNKASSKQAMTVSENQTTQGPSTPRVTMKEDIKEPEQSVTYFVDEEGRYYYQPAVDNENLTMTIDNTNDSDQKHIIVNEDYQTVTLVPSESDMGEVSYVLVVQDDKQVMNINIKEENDGDVYTFEDEEDIAEKADEPSDSLAKPKRKQKTSRPNYNCTYCNYVSHRKYLLLRHMKSHSVDRPFKCSVCDRAFKTRVSLNNHTNTHNGIKPHICKYCSTPFTTSGELVRHVRYKHTHEKPHRCTQCDYASVELSKLRRHIRCHTGERPYQCPHCTYASPDTFKLKRHLRTHTGEKPYKCDSCNMSFTQSNSLKAHKLIHNVSEKPVYACELCPAKCGRKTDLRIHIQKLHTSDKPLKCKRCGKTFPDRYSCKVHNKTHEGEKCYKCELCPYASTTLRHLKAHMLKHTDQKPFVCDQCNQCFRQKQLLRRHQNLYHNPDYSPKPPKEKTHVCHECNRSFAHKGNLIRHLAIHDPDSNHLEQALALRIGRQKKLRPFPEKSIREENSSSLQEEVVKIEVANNENKQDENMEITGEENQEYVVLEVIQLEDGSEQQVCLITPHYSDMERREESDPANADDNSEGAQDLFYKTQLRKTIEQNLKAEKDLDTCFGFDEEEEEEEVETVPKFEEQQNEEGFRLHYELSDEENFTLHYESSDASEKDGE
ncbi:transcriptional repressor CTCFL isoform X1 [Pieris rapae]|uniref:transcriptional repressor CTCFL isoform X1 n=1 Tax=Pieris rapae TaxID=64459 RepID=UPI001E27A3F0|nr:transcriptional repressor CTCFL isoform X1 [Pieris rapae]